jgi:hypothetical protein
MTQDDARRIEQAAIVMPHAVIQRPATLRCERP